MEKIGIIDYGMGNLYSVQNAVEWIGIESKICSSPEQLKSCTRFILPGVGAFPKCMERLHSSGLFQELSSQVLTQKKPILGICLGMQILAYIGLEGGQNKGLEWISGTIRHIHEKKLELKVPHIGWNNVVFNQNNILSETLKKKQELNFYFVHSYFFDTEKSENVLATCEYNGVEIVAAVIKENIIGTQFHPEKSQDNGIEFLSSFIKWNPC